MLPVRTFASSTAAAVAGIFLLAPAAAADTARTAPDPCACAALQHDVDAYRRGEVQYFVDPTPAWKAEAGQNGCTISGL